jgi:hypothetical protein
MKKQTFYVIMRRTTTYHLKNKDNNLSYGYLYKDKPEYFVEPVEGYPLKRHARWKWELFVYQAPGAGWFITEARTGMTVGLHGYPTMKNAIKDVPKVIDRLERLSQNRHFLEGYEKNVEIFAVAMNTYRKMEEMKNGETT